MTGLRTMIVGIGSDHGDDRIGWHAVQLLEAQLGTETVVRAVRNPLDMLSMIVDYYRLWIIDAVQGANQAGTLHRWQWPAIPRAVARLRNSHSLGVVEALELAEKLGCIPPQVVLWGIEVCPMHCRPCHMHTPITPVVETQMRVLLSKMLTELEPSLMSRGACHA